MKNRILFAAGLLSISASILMWNMIPGTADMLRGGLLGMGLVLTVGGFMGMGGKRRLS